MSAFRIIHRLSLNMRCLSARCCFLLMILDNYFDWRGFYYPYDELAPGPIVTTNKEIVAYIQSLKGGFDPTRVRQFKEKFMGACDGHGD